MKLDAETVVLDICCGTGTIGITLANVTPFEERDLSPSSYPRLECQASDRHRNEQRRRRGRQAQRSIKQ